MKTKQTPHGSSSSHQPKGIATARFTSGKEEQFKDVAEGDESQDSQKWPDLENPKCKATTQGEGEASRSTGKTGDQPSQAEGGAPAPPKENPPAPAPTYLKPGTSKDPLSPTSSRSHPEPLPDSHSGSRERNCP